MKLRFWQKEIDTRPAKVTVVHKFPNSDSVALPYGWSPLSADKDGVWAWKMVRPTFAVEPEGYERFLIAKQFEDFSVLRVEHDDFTTEPSD